MNEVSMNEVSMKQKLETEETDLDQTDVMRLLEQRAMVQEWLARLDQQLGTISDHVVEKVRADYERRLQETLDELGVHRRDIQAELERVTARLVDTEDAHRRARDELEEGRLRHIIGEIDDSSWAEKSAQLDQAAQNAGEREDAIRAESERLRDLLAQLEDRTRESPSVLSVDLPPESEAETDDFPASADFDAASPVFLEDIDRAIADSSSEFPTTEPNGDFEETTEDTAPKPGLKCSECGYTNDLSAWFCGVCGADVG